MHLTYPFLRRLGLGAHLAVIVALAAVPTSLLVIEFIDSKRQEALDDAGAWARSEAAHAADHHSREIAVARATLTATADRLEARETHPCKVPSGAQRMIWMVSPGGNSSCPAEPDFPIPETVVAEIVSETRSGFEIVGPYKIGAAETQMLAMLTRTGPDGVAWHIVQGLDLEWQPILHEELVEPAQVVAMAVDARGRIIERSGAGAELIGDKAAQAPQLLLANGGATPGHVDAHVDIDGVSRIFGTAAMPETGGKVVVGLSHSAVLATAERELIGSLALFAAVLTLSGIVAWLVIERMILRSVRKLRDAAVATARGEPQERVVITDGPVELRQLANAFNEMTEKLEFQAFHDQLTGLANRRYVGQRLDRLVEDNTPFAVLAVDLDGFKPINDTHGHAIGDIVLAEAARRLAGGIDGESAFIGRTGGDEFLAVVVCQDNGRKAVELAAQTAEDMLLRLTSPVSLDNGTMVNIGGCIGIAFWPRNGKDAEDVVREADSALYRAKKAGGNRFMVSGSGASRTTEAA